MSSKFDEFSPLPEGWTVKTTPEILSKAAGSIKIGPFGSQLRKEYFVETGFKVYGQENVFQNDFEIGDRRISLERFLSLSSCELHHGDVVISMMGTIGKCATVPLGAERGIMDSHLLRLKVAPDVLLPDLVAQMIAEAGFIKLQLRQLSVGGIMEGLSSRVINRLRFPCPPMNTQRRIAEILSTLDEAIEQTEALIEKMQQVKAGLMHDLFTRGVTLDGRLRPTREQAPELYKESPLGWIPKEWAVTTLADVAEVNRGKFTIRPRNDPRFYGGEYPFIQTGDVSLAKGRVLKAYSQTLNAAGLSVSKLFDAGTIMVTIAANIADTCILGVPMCAPDSLVGVLPNVGQVSRFLELCIRRRKSWFEARAPQTAQKNINLEDLRPLLIPTPSRREQETIAAIYEAFDSSLSTSEQEIERLRQQKHGLMHDLLTGRVQVPSASSD